MMMAMDGDDHGSCGLVTVVEQVTRVSSKKEKTHFIENS